MAGRRSRHECRSIGELDLKGLPDPVETVEVIWEPLGGAETNTVSLPGRLVVRPAVGVVGRDSEVQAIADAAKRVATGEGREILLISGEAGLGKTTLVAEASRAAFDNGAVVLFGHCEEDLATPYQLFAEALGHYVTHAPEEQLLAHVASHGSELSKLITGPRQSHPGPPALQGHRRRHASGSCSSPPWWGCSHRYRRTNPSSWSSMTSNGRTGRASFCSATLRPPIRPCGCS